MTGEGLCVMLRYAGLSNRVKSVLFSELNPRFDKNCQSAKVYAQAVWYFLEGLHLRQGDLLTENISDLFSQTLPNHITNNLMVSGMCQGF